MSTLSGLAAKLVRSRSGAGLRDCVLIFLLCTFPARVRLRRWFLRLISSYGDGKSVDVCFLIGTQRVVFSLRQGNEADYLIASEFLNGGNYPAPDFEPEQIIDGGANIGLFSIVASTLYPRARLICYEPDLDNLEQMRRNLHINGVRAEIHQLGLWSQDATLYYHARASHTGIISEDPRGVPVHCVPPEIGANCWLKLDVEMCEYEVIPALLKDGIYPRWISMEIHLYDKQGQLLTELLARHGYTISGGEDKSAEYANVSACRQLYTVKSL
jgi:FkbM family methyltransferase